MFVIKSSTRLSSCIDSDLEGEAEGFRGQLQEPQLNSAAPLLRIICPKLNWPHYHKLTVLQALTQRVHHTNHKWTKPYLFLAP